MTAINSRPVLVTGAAGFIGAALCQRLLQRGDRVIGIDNLNSYYEPAMKPAAPVTRIGRDLMAVMTNQRTEGS